jgi:hypothetical protein
MQLPQVAQFCEVPREQLCKELSGCNRLSFAGYVWEFGIVDIPE